MLSNQAVTADTALSTDSFTKIPTSPAGTSENQFSNAGSLLYNNGRLISYSYIGTNYTADDGSVAEDTHGLRAAYINMEKSSLDASSLKNYIVYNNSGKTVTEADGVFTIPAGCTNMVYGESDKVDVFERGTAVEGIYDIANYTTYTNSALADRMVIDTEAQSIKFDSQTRNWLAGTDDMTAFEASATIQGNTKGTIYAGFGFHMQADDFATETFKYSTSGYTVIVKRSTTSANFEILVRYISGTTVYDETINKITATGLIGTTVNEKINLKVRADNVNFYVEAVNAADSTKTTGVYTYPLDYTSASGKNINWTSGGFMLTANGVNTITDFELYNGVINTVDESKMVNASDLDAKATVNFPETLTYENQIGMSFRVQSAVDKPAPGVSGYVVKLLQTKDGDNSLNVQMTRYGTKTDGTANANLGNMYTYTDTTVLGDGSEAGASLTMEAKLRDNILTLTLTNADNTALTSTYTFDLTKASGSYSNYYEYGGFGFFKNGNSTDITISDVSFTKVAKNLNNIEDNTAYTVYRPEDSKEVTFSNNAFVNNDATSKKIMLNDTLVSDFTANTTLEVGEDGNLKGGIIFRAQNVGGETNAMDGYSAVVYKTPNTTSNYGRIVLLVYKWARLADGTMDYMGTVGSRTFLDTLNSVYPEAESDVLAAAGAKIRLNLEVKGDKVTANFDVFNSDNIVAESSADLVVDLNTAPTGVDSSKVFAEDSASVLYNAGAIGLSISTLGKICDFNITSMADGFEASEIAGYDLYSSNSNTLVTDIINNKIYSTTAGSKQAVLSGITLTDFTASATMKSTSAGATYNMGFDFMINEATHSGAAFNTTHATMGYEGYRVVLVRNANSAENPAGTTLYLFKFTKDSSGYTRTQIVTASSSDFFADYTSYGEIEVDFSVELIDGSLTATAVVCDYPERKITLTYDGLEGSGSTGWFINGGGSLTGLSVQYPLGDALVTADDCSNGFVYTAINSGAAKVGDTVKVVPVAMEGCAVSKVMYTVNGTTTEIPANENGEYIFTKVYGATTVSADFVESVIGDLNGDFAVDALDLSIMKKALIGTGEAELAKADLNGNGGIDVIDLIKLKKLAA